MQIRRGMRLREGFVLGGRLDRALSDSVPSLLDRLGDDPKWMEQALVTAMDAIGWSSPNPSVGAVIVDPVARKEISRGFTQQFRGLHAEAMAAKHADERGLSVVGATLYSTLEPCSHFGSQPPCADLVIRSGIKRVVIGTADPYAEVNGEGIQKLQAAGIEVVVGVLEPECQAWHFPFIRSCISPRKLVWVAKWAQTPEGDLADARGSSKWITNPKSRAYTHWLRQKYDAIVIGAETYLKDAPQLTVRDCAPPHRRNPMRFVLDRRARLQNSELAPGFRVVRALEEIEDLQEKLLLQSVMVEGGASVLRSLFEANLFDAAHQFVGTKSFEDRDSKYRLDWSPGSDWYCASRQKIDTDDLHEWVKCF